ncbi:NAD-dependent epimerase/dehydratase family protein [Fictibacillus phosphorivorans]|uniref:NAD-dependent epimerase/dehydratase family protein n=1 Tax=Fictibacillus phosphorivorans TaxID=1221500 RepID=UPI0020423EFA|nr:NAD-dependent epimerase/dehydratase family protein [Fictibacillus phosphorivorans]MCM3717426.1 NAD-dependent epimerase/dehydratase family protein [Fictibacillus phosphorivorans]MCM3775121.1 NAD-dependent epimerase/dehydratase family protein [Fictibacillus phosphorivorans]
MKVLIIGGTRFLGRHLMESFLRNNHEVTLFHRGKTTTPGHFAGVDERIGDREQNLSLLEDRTWDVVIDTCGYFPRQVRKSAEALRKKVSSYIFVSSVSVYEDQSVRYLTEDAKTAVLHDPDTTEMGENYGALKAACEKEVQNVFGEKALIIRPGLIVGPHDYTDRFTYWPHRGHQGGEILVPEMKDPTIRFIDARDLADWIVRMAENQEYGVYQAVGGIYHFNDFVQTCIPNEVEATIVAVPESFLLEEKVGEWVEMPLWIASEEFRGLDYADDSKARNKGLVYRSIEETIQDTAAWSRSRNIEQDQWKAGLHPDKEKDLLQKWKQKVN